MDRSTVDRLLVEHLPSALRFARRLTGNSHHAEEVVQESLCRVLKRWRSFRGESSFATWLFQIVVNVDRDRRRRERRLEPIPTDELPSSDALPVAQAESNELHERIQAAIGQLPDRQREVSILCLGEGLTAGQAAEVLGITEANVHTCLHLARKRIAHSLGVDCAKRNTP